MSRVGKQPIPIPDKVNVVYESHRLKVKGPKGELSRVLNADVDLSVKDGIIQVISSGKMKQSRALQGLTRTLVSNMIVGVTQGFERILDVTGVGYRVELKSNVLTMSLGYSHPVVYKLPEGISASVGKNRIVLSGIDKELLGSAAATIRKFRSPEPYKGKGIKYAEEQIKRKVGKTAGKAV
ncbi:MAG: 50S ribosomal protein L6 [Deltaproteobacteria bacterium]|nr:50S ribosomal protein L6 [Deltaproteobacteria bacterium]MBW2171362.1 50S ribosomal protein L6 [Deltaproteobacteria bacterium]MBW2259456.1 50S ribosomal protein L6 [Deltaproteobacteria bacterium]